MLCLEQRLNQIGFQVETRSLKYPCPSKVFRDIDRNKVVQHPRVMNGVIDDQRNAVLLEVIGQRYAALD